MNVYLNECSQEHTAHLLLEDHLVLRVVVAGRDEGGEQHSDEMWVAEVLEGQLTQFLQHGGLAARLQYHLKHTKREQVLSVSQSLAAGCKSLPCVLPSCKSATKNNTPTAIRRRPAGHSLLLCNYGL